MIFNQKQINSLQIFFRQAQTLKLIKITFLYTKTIYKLLSFFFESGFILKYYIVENYNLNKKKLFKYINIFFKYDNQNIALLKIFRYIASKKKFFYYSCAKLKHLYRKFNWILNSFVILTSKGLFFFPEVLKLNLGGIILFRIN